MEQKTICDYMVTCESCGKAWNLYDIPDGICPACNVDLTAEKKNLMKVLLAQDVFFDCDENGRILVPENIGSAVKRADTERNVTRKKQQTECSSPNNGKSSDETFAGKRENGKTGWDTFQRTVQ